MSAIVITEAVCEALDARVTVDPETGCWPWRLATTNGYGYLRCKGVNALAHRVSYTRHKGDIPDGLQIDHLCRNRRCVNPDHLEAVTAQTNVLRGVNPGAIAVRTNHCKRGHNFDIHGGTQSNGSRVCLPCKYGWRKRNAGRVA
jgi:hypothetical protein